MKTYYIVGSGGFAKEVLQLARQVFKSEKRFGGFIDTDEQHEVNGLGEVITVYNESSFIANQSRNKNVEIFIGIGNPRVLLKLKEVFADFNFPNLIHPDAQLDLRTNTIGTGNIVTRGCIFTTDISVGSFNIFNLNSTVGHDTIIGDCNVINPGVNISGEVSLGNANLLGTNATVLQQRSIGDHNIIGAASLVNKDVDHRSMIIGVPGRKVKDL